MGSYQSAPTESRAPLITVSTNIISSCLTPTEQPSTPMSDPTDGGVPVHNSSNSDAISNTKDHPTSKPCAPLQVIGAGWARTGLTSLTQALDILGYKSYHMVEAQRHKDWEFWSTVSDSIQQPQSASTYDFDAIFGKRNFQASLDWPSSVYYKEQMKRFPDAKVILTVRDPEDWYNSCCKTVFTLCPGSKCYNKRATDNDAAGDTNANNMMVSA
jgi:hypothetical protein